MSAKSVCRWFLLFLAVVAPVAGAERPFSYETAFTQLPKSVCPINYRLRLEPDLDQLTTRGTVTIEILVLDRVSQIVLNSLDLEITKATLLTPQREMTLHPRLDPAQQTLTLPLPEQGIGPGKYQLTLEFNGRITAQAQGLFYVKYAAGAQKKIMLATQMEPADARRMFPCWDEPVFRAAFELTVVVPQKHLAVSNMPIETQKSLGNGRKEVKFARTPPMASYLVVLVSGELEELKGEAEGVPLRIITTEGKRAQARYALDVTKRVLAYYNDYFGLRYPLPKLDEIAIPGGFGGAMENWGAITFNERNLLVDPASSSLSTRQNVFGVVAHEMAHQWFGDLVTTAWWDDLWLNEGFASWMSSKATALMNPDWDIELNADAVKDAVMNDDARSATHPILRPVRNVSEAGDAFDRITYQKGEAFLRMLENFLGAKAFRQGLHQFLVDREYSNATTADLWNALENASGKPVGAISAAWTEQPGLPLVTVKTNCISGRQVLTLSQERFVINAPDAPPLSWKIPVALMNLAKPDAVAYALVDGQSVSVPFGACGELVKANAGNFGYYRTAYEPALFQRLRQNLTALPAADQLNLLDDTWALADAGRVPTSDYLDLAQSLKGDKERAIVGQIISVFGYVDALERGRTNRAAFREYARRWLRPEMERLGWTPKPGDSPGDSLLRADLIQTLGNLEDPAVIAQARALYAKFLTRPSSLPADLRTPVLTIVGRYADRKTYDELHQLALKASSTADRQLYYRAMAGALDPELAILTLSISLTDETVPQEAVNLVPQVAAAGEQPELAWDFARRHMKELLAELEAFRVNGYVPAIMGSFSDAARADELEAYVKENVSEGAVPKAREAAEGIRFNAGFKERELPGIDRWVQALLAQAAPPK